MESNTKTAENLRTAFTGESQANRRYLLYAEKADAEGHPQVARLFRAAAEAESIHAGKHFHAMDVPGTTMEELTSTVMSGFHMDVSGSTTDNLKSAIAGEFHEFTSMYPAFIKEAENDENIKAVVSFQRAMVVEQVHHKLFETALKALESNQPLRNEPYFVCEVCGNTVAGEAPDKCPICGALRERFKRVD